MASLFVVPAFENHPSSSCRCRCHGPIMQRALFRRRWSPFERRRLSKFLDLAEDGSDFSDHNEGLDNLCRLSSLLHRLSDCRSAKKESDTATNQSAKTDKQAFEKAEQKLPPEDERNSNKFHVSVELGDAFKPSEISVKVVGKSLQIEGKHEETGDDGQFSCRQFTRLFHLPDDVDIENFTSAFSKEGVLSVEAPRLQLKDKEPEERNIPVKETNSPEAVEEKKSQEAEKIEEGKTTPEEKTAIEEKKEGMMTAENDPNQTQEK